MFYAGLGAHLARQRRRFRRLDHRRLFVYGAQPKLGASPGELLSFFHGDRTQILIATVIFCFSFLELLWFGAAVSAFRN